ncbi:hypothetical protein B224_0622 [Aeromonas media WS]|nr:hypothetical protein B224_0622 [Aeromonas media WS]
MYWELHATSPSMHTRIIISRFIARLFSLRHPQDEDVS